MNLLSLVLVLFSYVYNTQVSVRMFNAYLVKHNFWELKKNMAVGDKDNLCSVGIKKEDEDNFIFRFDWSDDFRFKENNFTYEIVSEEKFEDFINILKYSENENTYLRFEYFFTDKEYNHERRRILDLSDTEWYKSYKLLKSDEKTFVEMYKDEPINSIMHHISERFRGLFANDLLVFNKKILREWDGNFDKKPNFNLHYFKNYSDCFNDLKSFLEELEYVVLIDDLSNSVTVVRSKNPHQEKNILMLSKLINFFKKKFNEDYENNNMNLHEKQNLKLRFFEAFEKVKHDLVNYNMILPLNDFFTIEYHLEELYASIIKKICETQQNCICPIRYQIRVPCGQFRNYRHSDKESKKITLQDLYGHKNTLKYFLNYFNKQSFSLEDYFELEKVVCDFYNMVKYVSEMFNALSSDFEIQCLRKSKGYSKPIFLDNYECKLMKGINILFLRSNGKGKIKAFDNKKIEVTIEEGVDYFYDSGSYIFIPFENMLSKKIQTIEVFSEEEVFIEEFSIDKYLTNQKNGRMNKPFYSLD